MARALLAWKCHLANPRAMEQLNGKGQWDCPVPKVIHVQES